MAYSQLKKNDVTNLISLLRSDKQIREFYEHNGSPVPYVLRCHNKNQKLIFIGTTHCNDQNDPQFEVIRQEWAHFIDATRHGKRIVLTEGGLWPVEAEETHAIEQHGEPGLLTFLAHQADVTVATPEPPESVEGDFLLQHFPAEAIIYYYCIRQIPQWYRAIPRPDFRSYIQETLDSYRASLPWDFDFSVDHLMKIHSQLFNTPFNEYDQEFFDYLAGLAQDTVIHHVTQASLDFRNQHIAQELLRYWNQGLSIFSAYGSEHAYALEPMITELNNR